MSKNGDKKPKSVDDIIAEYQKYHHRSGKSFKDRIAKFEEFHDPENTHAAAFAHHAHYVIFGKPGADKDYPGAYNKAHLTLEKHLKEDGDKLTDEDKLAEIMESYVDTFLEKALSGKFKEIMKHASSEGLDQKKLRELKGQLMGRYLTDERGAPIDILSSKYLKNLKGKKKVDLISHLRGLGEQIRDSYTSHLHQEAIGDLVSEDDRLDLAKYISPIFKKKGLQHEDSHITRSAREQASHYGALLQGGTETLMKKAGYKPVKEEKKDKK